MSVLELDMSQYGISKIQDLTKVYNDILFVLVIFTFFEKVLSLIGIFLTKHS